MRITLASKNKLSPISNNPCVCARSINAFALAMHISPIAASAGDCGAASAGGCGSLCEAGDCGSIGVVAMLDGLGVGGAAAAFVWTGVTIAAGGDVFSLRRRLGLKRTFENSFSARDLVAAHAFVFASIP